MDSYYESPISETINQMQTVMMEEHEQQIVKAVQSVGINIDRDGLIAALQNDRTRYELAYQKGYADAAVKYEEKISAIRALLDGSREETT